MVCVINIRNVVKNMKERCENSRGKNRLTFVFQYRIKLNIKNKDQSIEMKTIMCQTCLNVLKNKEVSRIRKKSRYIDFWRYFPSILINGVLGSKYITKLHYHKTDANCISHNHSNTCAID